MQGGRRGWYWHRTAPGMDDRRGRGADAAGQRPQGVLRDGRSARGALDHPGHQRGPQLRLTFDYGIMPRDVARLPDIVSAPFLHFSWTHIEGNSGPLFIFGFLAAYRGIGKFVGRQRDSGVTSGFAAWFFEAPRFGRGRRQRRRLRILRLHHGARPVRPAGRSTWSSARSWRCASPISSRCFCRTRASAGRRTSAAW